MALAVTLLAAAACSSPQGTEPAENSLLGKDRGRSGGPAKGDGNAAGKRNPGAAGKTPEGLPAPGGGAAIATPGKAGEAGFSGASRTETELTSTGTDPRNASVTVTEPDPDADTEGVAPEFADILSTRVEGAGPDLRVVLTFRGELPQQMPDDKTYMVAGFGMTGPKGQSQGYAFGASADTTGWKAYGGAKDKRSFPGDFTVAGDTITFTIPWRAVQGPRQFEWYAQASWFKSLAGTTHYSLDALPNDGPAKYPAG
ncbi:MAG TPA: hypothetical protein VHN37_06915 [Actinomycetota bacterium]|nr:hypothetical protein [Actinomycetota bacterium]